MNVLIIGGTGLISTPITRQLLEAGHQVTLYNRGKSESRVPAGARQMHGDRRQFAAFEAQMRAGEKFDCVIDMVCFQPEEAESLVRAFRGRTKHLIFCSTVDVYARPTRRFPIREGEPRGGVSDYGKNKVRCEDILLAAHQRGDLPVTAIRPAQTYGEGGVLVHSFGWSTTFLDRLRRGKPVIVHGDGQSMWVACHIDDVARAFVGAVCAPQAFGKCYNTTGEEWMTWNDYHLRVAEALGAPTPTLVHIPTDLLGILAPEQAGICVSNFQFDNLFDNSAAMRDLGFRYTIPFVEGARRTYEWLEQRGRIENAARSGR